MGWLQRGRERKAAERARKEAERRQKEKLKSRRRFLRKAIGLGIAATGLGIAYKVITTPVEHKNPGSVGYKKPGSVAKKPVPVVLKPRFGPAPRPNCLDYRIIEKPSLSAKTIDRIIPKNSPMAGKGEFVLLQAVEFGIDPAVALAQFKIEGNFGLQGAAAKNKNPGNIRGKPRFEKRNGKTVRIDTFREFKTWEEGIRAYFDLIANGSYYYNAGRFDAEAIIPTYAPSADKNNPNAYIAEMRRLVDAWRSLEP